MELHPTVTSTRSINNFKTLESRLDKVHNNLYDYSKVLFIKMKEPAIIICKEHGEFTQRLDHHLRGVGCPHCAGNIKSTSEEFISKSKKAGLIWFVIISPSQ